MPAGGALRELGRVKVALIVVAVLLSCTCTTCGGMACWGYQLREAQIEQLMIGRGTDPRRRRGPRRSPPFGFGLGLTAGVDRRDCGLPS